MQHRRKLIEGHKMRCPRCKELQDILAFRPLIQIQEFISETNPIYKCAICNWMFSPGPDLSELAF